MFSFCDDEMFAADGGPITAHSDPNGSLPLEVVDSSKEMDLFGATQPLDMEELDRRQTFFGSDRLDFVGAEAAQPAPEVQSKRLQPLGAPEREELVSAAKYRELREKFKTLHTSYQRGKAERATLTAELERTRQALAQAQQQVQATSRYGSVSRRRSLSEVGNTQANVARGRTGSPVKLAQRRQAHKELVTGQATQDLESQYNAVVRQLAALQQWVRTVTHPPSSLMRPPGPRTGESLTPRHNTPRSQAPPVPPFRNF
eukprot:Hpha_TRINITY_DN14238_c0_g3::TRINITY_DN14238_c0_g3_i1::g.22223::m.22223